MLNKLCRTLFIAVTLAAITSVATSAAGTIDVTSATYGASCRQPHGNVTDFLKQACDGKSSCDYTVRWQTLGDPAVGCGKDFSVDWRCDDGSSGKAGAAPEAGFGSKVALICPARGAHR